MKTLYLIRHAKSSWDNPSLRDFDRVLNERGLNTAPFMADLLFKRGIKPDLIVSSPAARAFSTALFFAKRFSIPEDAIQKNLSIYEAYYQTIVKIINALPDTANTVLMFGHNPAFTETANVFTEKFIPNVPTCGIVQIESDVDTWAEFSELSAKVTACFFPKDEHEF